MNQPDLKSTIDQAKLTASREGIEQLEKEFSEQKRDSEFQKKIDELEKISSELRASNELLQKQANEAKSQAKNSDKRAWISIGIAGACGLLEIISLFLKGFHIL